MRDALSLGALGAEIAFSFEQALQDSRTEVHNRNKAGETDVDSARAETKILLLDRRARTCLHWGKTLLVANLGAVLVNCFA